MQVGMYAVIYIDEVLHFFDDKQAAYSEAYRLDEYTELEGPVYIANILDVLNKVERKPF